MKSTMKTSKTLLRGSVIALAVGLGAAAAAFDPDDVRGRTSAPGELQNDPVDGPSAPTLVVPRAGLISMEQAQARPRLDSREQPPRIETLALGPSGGGGQTESRAALAPATQSHLSLVFEVTRSGRAELVSATEIPGALTLSDEPKGPVLYRVLDGTTAIATEAIADPFEEHSFGGPEDELEGHHEGSADTGRIVVKVPGRALSSAADLSLTLHRRRVRQPGDRIDLPTVADLERTGHLTPLATAPRGALGPAIARLGQRLD